MDKYSDWQNVPDNLKTKTSLGRMGLRLAPGQKPVAIKTSRHYRTPDYELYDVATAVPKKEMSPSQQAALQKAQDASLAARTCQGCGFVEELGRPYRGKWYVKNGHCPACRHLNRIEQAREGAAMWAKQLLDAGDFVILDTETTGLEGELVEVAVIDAAGQTLFNRRLRPLTPVEPGAASIHGLTNEVLAQERPFGEFYEELAGILTSKATVIIYNAAFDNGRLRHTCRLHNLPPIPYVADCAMDAYAAFVGEWSDYYGRFKWQPLPGGDHSALGDCLAALDVLRCMAESTRESVP